MSANLENSAWPHDWKRSVFIPIPKKGNAKECSNYCTIALITGSSKKQEEFRKTSTTALLTMPKPLTVWITTNCENSSRDGEYKTTLPAS